MDRYEEALERAKKGVPIDEVFPELKESEDERIRKELIEFLTHSSGVSGFICKRWIAYLEKQKEQKPAEWSEEDKTHLCWIIECFDSWKYQVPEFADQYQSAIDWLKSTRPQPHWKPSEDDVIIQVRKKQ